MSREICPWKEGNIFLEGGRYPWKEEACFPGIKPAESHFSPTLGGEQKYGKRVWLHQGPVCWHCLEKDFLFDSSPSSINQGMKTYSCSLKTVATYNFPCFCLIFPQEKKITFEIEVVVMFKSSGTIIV